MSPQQEDKTEGVLWAVISNPEEYVRTVLVREAADIPRQKISRGKWFVDVLSLDELQIDQIMVTDHDGDPLHIKRRDAFVDSIQAGREINPLIALGEDLLLVDGYARYSALAKLGLKKAHVLRQRML